MNYGTLKADVAAYLHRSDLTSKIPGFIEHARRRIGRELRGIANQAAGTVTSFSAGRSSLPVNLNALLAVWLDDRELLRVTMTQAVPGVDGVYAVDGGDLIVPAAGASTAVDISYWSIPAQLVNDTDVSEGMDTEPDLWRFAAIREGAIYLHDWALADAMESAYQSALVPANRAGRDHRAGKGIAMSDPVINITAAGPGL